ncbi:alpha-humulene/(-)-(E)-beta-caryophyllene synthase isoform X12 [Brassica rapa]|uniref:alpha-humulene/(-)-(E)-beta-caryophyllene synthase isoform X12 n=1 Tax=Brassica campestris TaxID=3711 RepID=UPI0004F1A7B3|nr:alpha-humulene/(-)-(E)-beta-caryophyllene synthase isoform X12 [Brassica rapa]
MENEVQRPLADFPVNIWEDIFTSFSNSDLGSDKLKEKHITLKETVKESFMASRANPIENIKFIDTLCRIGVSYHFEKDITDKLEKSFDCLDFNQKIRQERCDLYTVGIVFQVFRQFGFKLSADVFNKFKDEDGKFKAHLVADARGMLSLYEAAQWSTPGEDTLDDALAFSNAHLEEISSRSSPHLAIRIKNALKHPFHKGISRIETRKFISYYEAEEKCDSTLLEFAKIDFNLLQMLYRHELACVTRWLPEAPNGIPDSMKHLYRTIIDFYDKLEDELEKQGRSGCGLHLKKSLKSTANGYMQEVNWLKKDYTAKFDEYKENAILSSAYYAIMGVTFVGMGEVAKLDAFEWLSSHPKIRTAAEIICRFTDDITSYDVSTNFEFRVLTIYKFEHKREHVATGIDCYMKQFCVSKELAVHGLFNIVSNAWKELNQELMRPHSFLFPFLMRILNLSRIIDVVYRYEDAYTHPEFLKEHIVSLLIENIPI